MNILRDIRYLFVLACLASALPVSAQTVYPPLSDDTQNNYPTNYFRHPINLPVSLSGDFAEIRPNHFHSGIDLRTGGKEGEKVYAPADGYVSRINISAWGGGKVLYITHPNGFRTVYMHLSEFCGEIGKFVHDYQYSHHVFAFDIELPVDSIKVTQGQLVALTGNTGGSGGPHLHYDIRYASNDQPINPLYFGIKYSDPIAPTIENIKIYPANSRTSINGKNAEFFLIEQSRNVRRDTVTVAGRFYIGIYTYDRMEAGSGSKNGVEWIELYVDGELFHRYSVPTFLFEETRAINAIIDYPQYRRNRNYYIVTRHLRGNRNTFCTAYRDNGYLQFDDAGLHKLEYRVGDYKGNTTSRVFFIRSKPDALLADNDASLCSIQVSGKPITYFRSYSHYADGFQAEIDPYTVYENDEIVYSTTTKAAYLTPLHYFNLKHYQLPPHKAFTVRLAIPERIPENLRSKLTVVCVNGNDCSACPSKIEDGMLIATTRSFGAFAIKMDTIAPTIKPVNFADGKTISTKNIIIKFSDNLTGVVRYDCYVNGEWVLSEHDGKTATLTASTSTMRKGKNRVTFILTDAVGNTIEKTWTLIKP